MTATRDRRPEAEPDPAETPWDERPILGVSRGLTWWVAVSLAFGLAAVAAVFDVLRAGTLGQPYQIGYVAGSVAAVCWVRRRNLFGPMVQPPLVFAITAVGSLLMFGDSSGSGLKQLLFSVVIPLTSNFPTMAVTTAITVAIGLYRIWRERDPEPEVHRVRADRDEDRASRLGRRTDRGGRAAGEPDVPGAERAGNRVGERTGGRITGRGGAGRPARGRAPLDPGHDDEAPGYGERSRRGRGGRAGTDRPGSDRTRSSGSRPWDQASGSRGAADQPPLGSAQGQAAPGPENDRGYGVRRPRSGDGPEARRERPVRGSRDEAGRPDPRSQRGRETGYPADRGAQRREAAPPRYSGEREQRSRRGTPPRRRPDDDHS